MNNPDCPTSPIVAEVIRPQNSHNPSAMPQTTTLTETANPSQPLENIQSDDDILNALDQLMGLDPSSSSPSQPDEIRLKMTSEKMHLLNLLMDYAINIDEVNNNGGIICLTRNQHEEIVNVSSKIVELKAHQADLSKEFKAIMGHTPQDLNEAQQKYFRAFLGAMQRFLIISNTLSSGVFENKFKINAETPLTVLEMAAENASDTLAAITASIPGVGIAFKGAAWLISHLLETKMINHLSPFSKLFNSPNQCTVMAHALADKLARIKEHRIQRDNTNDSKNSKNLLDRCNIIFNKYNLTTEEPGKVDQLAMKDVKKLMEYIYRMSCNEKSMTINGEVCDYSKLKEAVSTNSNMRDQIIDYMVEVITGTSIQTPTSSSSAAPQNTSQNVATDHLHSSDQDWSRDEAGPSTQSMYKEIKKLKKAIELLEQQQESNFKHDTFVAGRGQVQALAETSVWDHASPTGAHGFVKETFKIRDTIIETAQRVARLEEAHYGRALYDDKQPTWDTESGYDSGLDKEEKGYRTNANRLAYWIEQGDMEEVKRIIEEHPEAVHEKIKRKPE
ncbi:MAG: hypothetical protein P8176_16350, partial [Gammaproteobacteria bacterium]